MADAREQVGDYKLRKVLHTGQKSQVYEVIEAKSGRHFAMKLLLPEYSDDKEERRTLFHEAEIGMKMRHENVINVLKISRSEKTPNYVMELFSAGSLRSRLQSPDPADKLFLKTYAKTIFKQAATGLAYMNAKRIVHCDVKPENIVATASGKTKIIDFAIAKPIQKGFFAKLFHRRKSKVDGTPVYMSPEQIKGEILDGRSDVYSYAATVYELACGRPPFRGASFDDIFKKHLTDKPPLPSFYNPDVTDEFGALVVKMLAKKREQRPANFHEVMIALRKVRVYKSVPDADDPQ